MAVIVTVPFDTAVTVPSLTVATDASLLVHVIVLFVASSGSTVAVIVKLSPTYISFSVISKDMDSTGISGSPSPAFLLFSISGDSSSFISGTVSFSGVSSEGMISGSSGSSFGFSDISENLGISSVTSGCCSSSFLISTVMSLPVCSSIWLTMELIISLSSANTLKGSIENKSTMLNTKDMILFFIILISRYAY